VTEILIVSALILLNGLFALSELAVVSSRRSRLRAMVESGRHGAKRALALAEDPGRFLSTVQIGITLIGIVSGAYSGATLGVDLARGLSRLGISDDIADELGIGLVVVVITYASLIVGELVPKHLALRNAERIACLVAPLMTLLARIAAPLVWLLDRSTDLVLRLLGRHSEPASQVTEEEIKTLVAEAESAGIIEPDEKRLISGVLRLGDRRVGAVMTPRTEVEWIDVTMDEQEVRSILARTQRSLIPAAEGSVDAVIGVIQVREVLGTHLRGEKVDLRALVRKALVVPDTTDALDLMGRLRTAEIKMALVVDEYGHFEGVVTPADLLEAIAGFTTDAEADEPAAVQRDDGSWLLAGWMPVDEMAETIGYTLPEERPYHTVAGFVLSHLHHLPSVGEHVEVDGWSFEVVDLDGRRIDKVLASRMVAKRRAWTQ
jgi:putative hemolysin